MSGKTRDWESYRPVAAQLAGLGGAAALARLGEPIRERKRDESPVTEVDGAVQSLILDEVGRRFPEHAVIVEEHLADGGRHASRKSSRHCWVVDPIDGTRNFARGLRLFACSVAMLYDGEPVTGAIFDASTGVTYSASRGGGTWLNDRRLGPIDRPRDADTTVAFSSFRRIPPSAGIRSLLDEVLFRNVGAACLHMAWIAGGFIDAMYAPDTRIWDIAAGSLLITEAGGVVTDERGGPRWPVDIASPFDTRYAVVAGTPTMHKTLIGHV